MTVNLNGARVLLTGATGGIGHAIARALHARGAELILTGRRTEVLDELAAEIGGTTIACDLSDPAAVSKLMDQAGDIDVLVANAALPAVGAIADYTEEGIDRDLDVNLRAPIVLTRWATKQMLPRGRGHIVLIGSLAGRAPSPLTAMYNATKFGLRGFALAHRDDLHGTGVEHLGRRAGIRQRRRHVRRKRHARCQRASRPCRRRRWPPRSFGRSTRTSARSWSRRPA